MADQLAPVYNTLYKNNQKPSAVFSNEYPEGNGKLKRGEDNENS